MISVAEKNFYCLVLWLVFSFQTCVCVLLGINFFLRHFQEFYAFRAYRKIYVACDFENLTRSSSKTALKKKMRKRGYKTPRGLILTESKPSDTVFLLKQAEFPGFHCRKFEGRLLYASSLLFFLHFRNSGL